MPCNLNRKLPHEPLPSRLGEKGKKERITQILNFVSIVFLALLMKVEWSGLLYSCADIRVQDEELVYEFTKI